MFKVIAILALITVLVATIYGGFVAVRNVRASLQTRITRVRD